MIVGQTFRCTECRGQFEARFGAHPTFCPFCGEAEVFRA